MKPLVSAAWLRDHLDEVIVADVRWSPSGPPGKQRYAEGHIPGAHFVDLDADLSLAAPAGQVGGRHPLPSLDTVAAMLARIGHDGRPIVAYDERHGAVAARLWWMLRYVGLDVGAVLDGGLAAWTAAGGELTDVVPSLADGPIPVLHPRGEMVARADDVAERDPATLLLDARAPGRFRGDHEPLDPRAGHIPGATNAPWEHNLEGDQLRPREALQSLYRGYGLTSQRPVIAYCGSGVTACHDLLALSLIGRDDARLYVGSWSDWSSDAARPGSTGSEG